MGVIITSVRPEVAPGQNAHQGVEKVHYEYECRIDIESSDNIPWL